jgi:hypothetical protein
MLKNTKVNLISSMIKFFFFAHRSFHSFARSEVFALIRNEKLFPRRLSDEQVEGGGNPS